MANSSAGPARPNDDHRITLDILEAVQRDNSLSQRQLAQELGIALGLTNAYLKRCVRKGWIKIKAAPANRYGYYLTPNGFAEKGRLTARFLRRSFHFYLDARAQLNSALAECEGNNWTRVALFGSGELAEIAVICAMDHVIEIVGVVDAERSGNHFARLPLVRDLGALGHVDAVIVTGIDAPQSIFDDLAARLPAQRVLTPRLLRVDRGGHPVEAAT